MKSLQFTPQTLELVQSPREPEFVQNPYLTYKELHKKTKIFYWKNYDLWCVIGFAHVMDLLRDKRLGRQRPDGLPTDKYPELSNFWALEKHSLLELEPPDHTRLRALINRAFVTRQIERLRDFITDCCDRLLDDIDPANPFELIDAYATPLPIRVITELVGVPAADGPQLLAWSHAMVKMYTHVPSDEDRHLANEAAEEFSQYLKDQIAKARAQPADNLLCQLMEKAEDGKRLSEAELISTVVLLLNAGHEATVHQLGNAVHSTLTQPADIRHLFTQETSCQAAVEECLRLNPPLHLFTRYVYAPFALNETIHLEPGAQIGLLLGAANHDPDQFEAPDAFVHNRDEKRVTSFGGGIHFCIGAALARMELQIALKALFTRFPRLALDASPQYSDSFHFHGLSQLWVKSE